MLTVLFSVIAAVGAALSLAGSPVQERVIYTNGNIYTVYNAPSNPTRFSIDQPMIITSISTYHWNNARGARPGNISLRDGRGNMLGPWVAAGSPGMNGVPNANWTVKPNIRLEPGVYTVVDSDNATWSQNPTSQRAGMVTIKGYVASKSGPVTGQKPTPTPGGDSTKATALTENRARYKVLIWVDGKPPKTPMDVLNYHLEPGWKGSLPVAIPPDGRIKFIAGDGSGGPGSMYDKVLTSCVWTGDPKNSKRYPHIIFESSGTLTCSTAAKP